MATPDIRKVVFSSNIFGGFTVMIDLAQISNITEIESTCTAKLFQVLTYHNFEDLLEKARCFTFHIHYATFEQIQRMDPKQSIYICDSCGEKDSG